MVELFLPTGFPVPTVRRAAGLQLITVGRSGSVVSQMHGALSSPSGRGARTGIINKGGVGQVTWWVLVQISFFGEVRRKKIFSSSKEILNWSMAPPCIR